MQMAMNLAKENKENNFQDGGPFGAVIVKDDKVISEGKNEVLAQNDPTMHAEIVAIRRATSHLKNHSLKGCTLYTTCYPCPMCLSAIIWADIDKVYYGNTAHDAKLIGFKDEDIYDFIKGKNKLLDLKQIDYAYTIKLFEEFKKINGQNY
jgi:tRNA(Arg) A34 adenosine deaminase TadA